MQFNISSWLCFSLIASLTASMSLPAAAQDVGRVSPASMPLPMPMSGPVPPTELRAHNKWNLSMTGTWKFQLVHGKIDKQDAFVPESGNGFGVTASSHEDRNPPENAFDGTNDTRWCAAGGDLPQWLQTDLGQDQLVTGVTLAWEHDQSHYEFIIEGKKKDGKWVTLADETAAPGMGDGVVTVKPATVRYVRITVIGTDESSWASIREFQIHLAENGQDVVWKPLAQPQAPLPNMSPDAFAATDFNDADWSKLPVPANWEIYGFSEPTYGWVDDAVGEYRRWVNIPAAWTGRKIYWHFDGALDGAEIFVNGQKAGYHESGYTAWDIDLTGLVRPGEKNLFAVRLSKSTPSSDCETGDYQCLGGIYRDTSLMAVPPTHVSDITVRTPLDEAYQNATLKLAVEVAGEPGETVALKGELYDAGTRKPAGVRVSGEASLGANGKGTIDMAAPVKTPALWSAEKPNLYYVVMQLSSGGKAVERVEQRFGFKQIDFVDGHVLWNGRPIKCTGSCRHDYWGDRGFALTEANWQQDITMMKAANINAVRTSHYNHAQRFLEICEERGMYILDEVPYCWIGDSVKDPTFTPYLLQRATETLARDKNRPCVLAWSLGNENPMGPDSQEVIDMVRATDPTRPAFVSCQSTNDVKGQFWDDGHYPSPESVDDMVKEGRPVNYTENPHTYYQKEVEQYDPGTHDLWSEALLRVWSKVWPATNILGSFIWEWQCQGIEVKNSGPWHIGPWGPDNLPQENNKGIVTEFRVPKPEWWIVKQVYSPVQIGVKPLAAGAGAFSVPITNRYSFTDLSELICRWTAYAGGRPLQDGVQYISCAPLSSITANFPAPKGATRLHLEFDHVDGTPVVSVNVPVAGAPVPQPPAALAVGSALTASDEANRLRVGNDLQDVVFDKATGTIQSWQVRGKDILTGGPVLNLGEAKALHDKSFYRAENPPALEEAQVSAGPAVSVGAIRVITTAKVLTKAQGQLLGTLTCTYDIKPDAEVTVHWDLNWKSEDKDLWEEGVKLRLPAAMSQMSWYRDSYFTDYPVGGIGAPSGECDAGDVRFRASKRRLHWLTLTDRAGTGVALLADGTAPLVARAHNSASEGTTLFASVKVAGPRDLSGDWVSAHDIKARDGHTLSGAFTLRAVVR